MGNVIPLINHDQLRNAIRTHVRVHGCLETVEQIRRMFSELSDISFNGEDKALSGIKHFEKLDQTQDILAVLVKQLRKYDEPKQKRFI